MSKKFNETVENPAGETAASAAPVNTAKYTVDEFAAAHETVFDGEFHQDIIRTALMMAGVKEATIDEARAIIEDFANKEVTN